MGSFFIHKKIVRDTSQKTTNLLL